MELRVLQYFLAVTREQNISAAAEALHLSQPTLSRQLKDLEDELGKTLFERGNRKITLTEEGMILRKRAGEIMELVKKTESEISLSDSSIAGDITIGTGESDSLRQILKVAKMIQEDYPQVHFHIKSGDTKDINEQLERGLIDFGILFGGVDESKYEFINIPVPEKWGVLMRRDFPLAEKDVITPEDLLDKPLIITRSLYNNNFFVNWFKCSLSELNIVATYSLLFNGSLMVCEGMGYALCFDKIINVSGDSSLCIRPLSPAVDISMNVVWKKYQVMTRASEKFLSALQSSISGK